MQGETQTYKSNRLTFVLTPTQIVVTTSLGQSFYLKPKSQYWTKRMIVIREMIKLDEVRTLEELAQWCASGGIEWVTPNSRFDVANPESMLI